MKTVYVGLSGGVDSSVAAALLQQRGYDVAGAYMKNWTQGLPGVKCPWQEDLNDARMVAAKLDIPFKVYDFESEYRSRVVDYLIREYQAGRTPNPDIVCNQEIKFKLFLESALADGADMIATGHYAKVEERRLLLPRDSAKDQTYFLYRVSKEALERTLFPVGKYAKTEIRNLATDFGLVTATKKDSQGICFIGPVGMKSFLRQHVTAEPGPILMADGTEIGQHDGAIFYTIGQRQGLGVGGGKPFYVAGKDMETNTVYVTDDSDDLSLQSDRIQLEELHWIDGVRISSGGESGIRTLKARFRHRGEMVDCKLDEDSTLQLAKPVSALAAGQSAVLYDGDVCLGGGVMAPVSIPAIKV